MRARTFSAFVENVEPQLMGFLTYFTGSLDDAEDLFQEALLAAHADWAQVSGLTRPEAWLFRVARNKAVNRFKRRDIERKHLRALPREESDRPAENIEADELRQAVNAALDTLPGDEREALCLKVWGGMSWVEIARTLDVSEDKAARLFSRALKAVAPRLKELA